MQRSTSHLVLSLVLVMAGVAVSAVALFTVPVAGLLGVLGGAFVMAGAIGVDIESAR